MKTSNLLVAAIALITCPWTAHADDWAGWMGTDRSGVYRESGIVDSIPDEGLPVKWRAKIAGGYAGPAVADGKVFLFDYLKTEGDAVNNPGTRAKLKGKERLTAFDAQSGEPLWQTSYECPYAISYPVGPRCTPTVDGDRVYTLGSEGDLQCRRVDDGTMVWSKNFKQDFGVEILVWGAASHPLIAGDLLYTMVGGEGQGIVAFEKMTGDVKWKALDVSAGYAPPTIITAGGQDQLIVFHPKAVASLSPQTGQENWSIPLEPLYEMAIARPVVDGNHMYASGIRTESVMIELDSAQPTAKELWRGIPRESLFCANSTPAFVDGVIYGTDCNEGSLMAVNGENGSQLWKTFEATKPGEKRFVKHGTAFLTRVGDSNRYLIMSENGDLLMARLTAEGFESLGRFHVLEPTSECFGRNVVWSHPAYANQTAYVRNDEELVAVDLKATKE